MPSVGEIPEQNLLQVAGYLIASMADEADVDYTHVHTVTLEDYEAAKEEQDDGTLTWEHDGNTIITVTEEVQKYKR